MKSLFFVNLPEAKLLFHVKHDLVQLAKSGEMVSRETSHYPKTNLLLAGGRVPEVKWLQSLASEDKMSVYCADKGVDYALAAGLSPSLVVGDCDSSSPAFYEQAQALGAKLELHLPAKDDTDLQLLLAKLPAGNLVATGIWGGRFDHLFSNVYSLLSFKEQHHCQVILADEQELMLLLTSEDVVEVELKHLEQVHALSLLPLGENSCVSLKGVRWPLEQAFLSQQRPYSISNEAKEKKISCSCHSGKVGLYIHWQKRSTAK